ncbi:MAG: PD40 domain-containing protein [Planctomycetes bacterium]|nr:PD40 domain-containing protein [Planctomycetota bacterium]
MRRRLRFGLALLCLLAAVAALAALVVLRLGRPLYYSDGVGLVRADALADRPMQVFERPTPRFEVPGPVRGRFAVLPDGRLLYGLARSAERTELVSFDPRLPDSAPVPLAIGAGNHEFSPCLDERGELWFCSDREGGAGGFDLWRAAPLGEGRFAAPTPLPATVNSPADEVDPALAPEGTTLVFARRVPDETRTRLHVVELDADLPARALWPDDEREPFARLSRVLDREPAFARDGTWLFFVRETQAAGKRVFGVPRLGTQFDRPLEEHVLGEGGRFHAPSPLGDGEGFTVQLLGEGERPLLYAARARLLRPWWEGQRALERLLLWVLGLALLLLALLLLGARWRALDIVTWCILVSLLVHVLLWWLLEDVLMGLREPAARGDGERIAITLIDGETAAAAAAAASGDRSAQAWRAERADRAEAASVSAPAAALASANSVPATDAELVELTRSEPSPQALATADAAASLQDAPTPSAPRSGDDALPASELGLAAAAAQPRPAHDAARPPVAGDAVGITVTAPGAGELPKDLPATATPALAGEAVLTRAVPAPSAAALDAPSLRDAPQVAAASARPALAAALPALAGPAALANRGPRETLDEPAARPVAGAAPGEGELVVSGPAATALPASARAPAVEPVLELRPAAPVAGVARRKADAGLRDALVATAEPAARTERVAAALSALAPGSAQPLGPTARNASPAARPTAAPRDAGDAPVAAPQPVAAALPAAARPATEIGPALPRAAVSAASPSRPLRRGPSLADAIPASADGQPSGSPRAPKDHAAGSRASAATLTALAPRAAELPRAARRTLRESPAPDQAWPAPASSLPAAPRGSASGPELAARTDLAALYGNRFGPQKAAAIERFGGSVETERAVAAGLAYLASIQDPRGHWGRKSFEHAKYGEVWVGKTALCVLAFLGAGHTPRSNTQYSAVVDRAIEALLDVQGESTAHFGDTSSYSHGIATYALAECLAISGDARLREPVQRAVTWILANQDSSRDRRNRGGWGYFSGTRTPEDGYARTSITVWQVMALESSKLSGIAVDDEVLAAARSFLRSMFDSRRGSFRYNHEPGRLNSNWPTLPASTPGAVFCLLLLGEDVEDQRVQAGLRYTLERRPRAWRDASDDAFVLRAEGHPYFWYCGTLACFLAGGDAWREWNDALKAVFLPAQNADGSFTPIGAYSEYAGDRKEHAAFTTALAVLSLEVYYRYVTPLLTPR